MYLNKVQIIGNLTREPELKALPSGMKTCSFSVAINRTWKDKDDKKQEAVEYVNIVSFGVRAETIAKWCGKGDQIYVEGRLQTRSWEDKDGVKKYATEVVLDNFQFGNNKKKEDKPEPSKPQPNEEQIDYPADDINPEDIPF